MNCSSFNDDYLFIYYNDMVEKIADNSKLIN